MNLLRLSLSYLRRRPLVAALNALLLALGVATIVLLLLFSGQLRSSLERDARGIDLVVGAKGSPLQLILSSIYHIDAPTGNVPLREVLPVIRSPFVGQAIPLGMGDSYQGFPIVGTTPEYLRHYSATLAAGRLWAAPYEVVVGSEVARRARLSVGQTFTSSHGLSEAGPGHTATPMRVVGVLAPSGSVVDRLVVTGLPTVWDVHEAEAHEASSDDRSDSARAAHVRPLVPAPPQGLTPEASAQLDLEAAARAGREVTAVLVRYRSPMAVALFPRQVDAVASLKSAVPAMEIARLMTLLGVGARVLRIFGLLLMATALLGVFVTLYSALRERRYDLAMMRTLGASRGRLFAHVLLEGLLMATFGLVLGLLLGHGAAELAGRAVEAEQGFRLTGLALAPGEGWLVLAALGVGVVAALIPAVQAYRTDIAEILAGG